jgi:uncharacterized membrane protein
MDRRGDDKVILKAAALGAIAGMRSMAAPALLTHEFAEQGPDIGDGRFERLLSSDGVARVMALFAGGEMLADKSEFIPDRTSPLPLVGRAVIGSLTAAAFAVHRRHPVFVPAAVGAASAIASTFAAYHLRRYAREELNVPDKLLGLVEDAIVVAVSKSLADEID